MASGGERRMVFDTRGRRKHVVRVVYAVLALLMGGSLFLTVGPFNIGELFGGQSASNASEVLDEQAEGIERRLAKDPTNEALLLSATRTRMAAGNAQVEVDPATGAQVVTPEARVDFETALVAWNRYLKLAGDEANASAAQLVAGTFFKLAESGATSLGEIESNVATAVTAQKVATEQRPNLGSLSSLAIYQFFNGDFAAGDKATKQAAAKASTKAEAKGIEKQLAEYRKSAAQFNKQKEKFAKAEQEAGKEKLENPFGAFGTPPPGQ